MNITHAKVSGEPNPADPAKIGGEDWDDPHVVTGLRLAALVACTDSNGTFAVNRAVGMPSAAVARGGVGMYSIYLDDAGLPPDDCEFVVVPEVNDASGVEPLVAKVTVYPTGGPLGGGECEIRIYRNSSGTMLPATYCKFKVLAYRFDA